MSMQGELARHADLVARHLGRHRIAQPRAEFAALRRRVRGRVS